VTADVVLFVALAIVAWVGGRALHRRWYDDD
jgi:hypothetical protein